MAISQEESVWRLRFFLLSKQVSIEPTADTAVDALHGISPPHLKSVSSRHRALTMPFGESACLDDMLWIPMIVKKKSPKQMLAYQGIGASPK